MANNVTFRPELVEEGTILSVENLKQYFGSGAFVTKAVDNVSFKIKEGECFGIVGESGCGKSTLLNIISGMESLTSGSFSFKERIMSDCSEKELTQYRRENIGFIFQSYNLMPNLTAKENLDLIGELVKNPMDSMELLKIVNLEEKY